MESRENIAAEISHDGMIGACGYRRETREKQHSRPHQAEATCVFRGPGVGYGRSLLPYRSPPIIQYLSYDV